MRSALLVVGLLAVGFFAVGWCAVPRPTPPMPCVFREAATGFALIGHARARLSPARVYVQTLDGYPADRETVEMLARVCAAEGAR